MRQHSTFCLTRSRTRGSVLPMALWQDTGQTPARRSQEAAWLVDRLQSVQDLNDWERTFVNDMAERLEQYGEATFVSAKQLFKLRDIADKYT